MKITFIAKNHHGQIQDIGVEYSADLLGICYYLGDKYYQLNIEGDGLRAVAVKCITVKYDESELIEYPQLIDLPSISEIEKARKIIAKCDERKHYQRLHDLALNRIQIAKRFGYTLGISQVSNMSDSDFDNEYGSNSIKYHLGKVYK